MIVKLMVLEINKKNMFTANKYMSALVLLKQ